ncbi:biopolymer transporter ExbD [Stenotrophomonas sp. ZAC14D2_NAIMI4_7]|uniref:ExbD/TolR family protein n=1 Tax=Stenotrophomonas TaxID=40323 RepID=UPI000D541022|nr:MULTISPECIES: biopolymer transporter ExbD [Stenotrophomonas]AWH18565.1 biopolymer transporter ExbD [Stenotrophomonas sp. ZAC14D2_NAIMI4_7]AWH22729.1 biopolymer transporter ExbD [Stenotrophomonas sp. ZAC14D2_NAIMI4_6]MBK0027940.1 biopolymer transporter ExbD [Stenotrophomonas sp. S48]MBK0048181.1 biopolymer transporter ExbD [Stenotrophomonas sp. S49]
MAFSSAGRSGPLAEINVTPLVDVMLVLLIIFIVTAPIVARPITVDLPQATDRVVQRPDPPPPIELRLDAASQLSWNGQPMAIGDLQQRLRAQAGEHAGNLPELRISSDPSAEYEGMARILAAAEATGMQRIAFVR